VYQHLKGGQTTSNTLWCWGVDVKVFMVIGSDWFVTWECSWQYLAQCLFHGRSQVLCKSHLSSERFILHREI